MNKLAKTAKELNVSKSLLVKASTKLEDLRAQAEMLDMDVDIEAWSLMPRTKKVMTGYDFYMERLDQSDYKPDGSDDQEYDDEQ